MNANRLRATVIVPAYRAHAFVARAVHSVLIQTYTEWELVVVADDDADYGAVLAAAGIEDPRIRCVKTSRHSGAGAARNVGLSAASTALVVSLDADDTLHPHALERMLPHAVAYGAAYSDVHVVADDTGAALCNLDRELRAGPVGLEEILTSRIHTYASIAFDRSRVSARWPEGELGWEDVWFHAACFDDIDAIYHLDEPLYTYRRRAGSTSTESGAAEFFLRSARRLRRRLENVASPAIRRAEPRETLIRYLRGREHLEARFIEEHAAGSAGDFLEFVAANLDLFYRLDPEVPVP